MSEPLTKAQREQKPYLVRKWDRALRGDISQGQKRALKLWDEYGGRCGICKSMIPHPLKEFDKLTKNNVLNLDHILPKSKGGSSKLGNLRPTHAKCNLVRGNDE